MDRPRNCDSIECCSRAEGNIGLHSGEVGRVEGLIRPSSEPLILDLAYVLLPSESMSAAMKQVKRLGKDSQKERES